MYIRIFAIIFLFYGCSVDPSLLQDKDLGIEKYKNKKVSLTMIIVKPNDTLYSISNSYNISIKEIKKINKLEYQSIIKIGQKLFIPSNKIPDTKIPFLQKRNLINPNNIKIALPIMRPNKNVQNNNPIDLPLFIWPLSGNILNNFGMQDNGIHNDGINILGNVGDPVLSSSIGEVIFVGENLKGFGSMVLIKHNKDLVSSYAHLSKIIVYEGEKVQAGQIIGQVGDTGRVTIPQLYFEIRNNNQPIDPKEYFSS